MNFTSLLQLPQFVLLYDVDVLIDTKTQLNEPIEMLAIEIGGSQGSGAELSSDWQNIWLLE